MNIAMMVRGYIPVPRPADMVYAPIDLAIEIGKGLAERGHSVTFFAPLGSELDVPVETLHLRPLARSQKEFHNLHSNTDLMLHSAPALWDRYMINEMIARAEAGEYDILHFHHFEVAAQTAAHHPGVPFVYTLHDPISPQYREMFEMYASPNQHCISISNNQRRDAPDLPYAATAYDGVDTDLFPFSDEEPGDYLLCAGRIVPEKGIKEAIQVAEATGERLLIIGPVYADHQDYFDQHIKPHLNDRILHLGFIDHDQMWRYFQKAKAFLTPVQWEEPFGLMTIEALACGTPVISLRRGAAPEIIVDGKTGFVVDSIAEMIAAVGKLANIDRRACRAHVEANFSLKNMVDAYEKVFGQIVQDYAKAPLPAAQNIKTSSFAAHPGSLKQKLKTPKQLLLPITPKPHRNGQTAAAKSTARKTKPTVLRNPKLRKSEA